MINFDSIDRTACAGADHSLRGKVGCRWAMKVWQGKDDEHHPLAFARRTAADPAIVI